jgi:TonB family protein
MKNFVFVAALTLGVSCAVISAQENPVRAGIVNGMAIDLPKPVYPQEAKEFCAEGRVEVEVLISEAGKVLEAEAISGDELLREVSVEAVKKAKFRPAADGAGQKERNRRL